MGFMWDVVIGEATSQKPEATTEGVFRKRCFCNIHRKTPVLESLINEKRDSNAGGGEC